MADFFQNILTKRRNRSSNSSAEESPDAKKPRGSPNSSIDTQQVNERDDEFMAAASMVEDVQQKLQVILQKLGKHDSIEKSVNKIQDTLVKLEARTQSLESFQQSATADISDLKESPSFSQEKYKASLDDLKRQRENLEEKLNELERQNNHLDNKIKDVEIKNLYLEAYSRRENIKFENISEDDNDNEDTEQRLRTFLETDLGFRDAHTVEIQRVHRLGRKKTDESRPILARFLRFKDCEKILSLGRRLWGTAYKMYQDLPHEIVQRRKNQMDTFRKARENRIPATFSKAQPHKLYIRGKLWPVGKTLDI